VKLIEVLNLQQRNPLEILRQRQSVGIFAEGCYSDGLYIEKKSKLIPKLSQLSKYPIIPVFIFGIENLNWKEILLRRRRVVIIYGEPIYVKEKIPEQEAEKQVNHALLDTRLRFIKLIHGEEKNFWNGYAQFYHYLERAKPYQDLVNEFDKNIPSVIKGKWIDLGSGSGMIVDLLLKKINNPQSAEILATDFDKTMLGHLSKRLNNNNLKIKELDLAMSFDLPDNYFDGVTANLVLSYIIHHESELGLRGFTRLLEDIYKILKPGGKFIWSSPRKGVIFAKVFLASWKDILNPRQTENLYYGPAILKQALRIQNWGKRGIYHFLDTKEIEKILKEIGFINIKFSRSMANQVDIISCEKPKL